MNEVIKIVCPRCRHQFEFPLHTGIYLEKEPELRDKIKDLSLLGFIDVAENGKILLNVSSFSDSEAKAIIEKGE